MREAGIDILIELMISKIKFGIQIKTPNDIKKDKEKEYFIKNVKAQIFDSKRHRLTRTIVAIAGDLNNKSHSEKIGALNSEINQSDYLDVIVLQPQKMVTIYNTFVKNEYPMKHLLLEQQTAAILLQGIVEGLSNEERTMTANINIKYLNEINNSEPVKTITLKTDDPKLLDDIEKLHYTGELMKFDDRLKDFSVKTSNGIEEVRLKGEDSISSGKESLYAFSS